MKFEVIGGMIASRMVDMMTLEKIDGIEHVETYGLRVSQFSYAKSAIAANKHLVSPGGEIVLRYKVLGDIPMGMQIDELKAIMKRNDRILIFWSSKKSPSYSAIAYSGELDLDMLETLCLRISNSIRDRDTQRKACYKVCHILSPVFGTVNVKQAEYLVDNMCQMYNIPRHKIEFKNNLESDVKDGCCYTIPFDSLHYEPAYNVVLCRGNREMSRDTLIHEMAHLIARYEYQNDSAVGHGPAFMAIYFELLARYGFNNPIASQRTMVKKYLEIAAEHKVKVDAHCILVDGEWYAPKPKKRAKKRRIGL